MRVVYRITRVLPGGVVSGGGTAVLLSLTVACNAILGVEDVSLLPPDVGSSCAVNSDFQKIDSSVMQASLQHRTSDGGPSVVFLLNSDPKVDALGLLLYDNLGGHTTLNAPGMYNLNLADAKLETCGICVFIYADFDQSAGMAAQTFMARGQGTLTLTTASSSAGLIGSMHNLLFRHVDTSNGSTVDVNDGCSVTVEDVEFNLKYSTNATP